ncbi:hypothetical protein BG011_007387 [Mortierella polycephala]|uniref:G-protein coupled receptors family 2 profile 2 domain-containing protein n=1 Tax=Mortierella polycephala TaxID=41804 RepID=A0A9P6PST6_9FUNG|nr:hypothetical protein BG011_007387 [Mortierella polycephala]
MVPWEGIGTAWLFKKEELLCKNVYEIATMSNSWFCGLQGIVLMYLVLVMLCLSFILIANLHLLTVFRSPVIQSYLTKWIILSFFLPLSLVVPVAVRKQIENPGFGSICFVSAEVASPFFFYPLSVIVCIATLLHLGTIAFMIRARIKHNATSVGDSTTASYNASDPQSNRTISNRQRRLQTARDISHLLKQQWRPGLFALCLLIMDMIYWLFYFTEAKKLEAINPTTQWFVEWLQCLGMHAMSSIQAGKLSAVAPTLEELATVGDMAQSACASIAYPYVPSFSWAALADLVPAVFGIMILVIFGSRLELWRDLRTQLFGEKDSTVFIMDNLPKDKKDQYHRHQSQHHQQLEGQQNLSKFKSHRQSSHTQNGGFYSDELLLDDNAYNNRDILVHRSESRTLRHGSKCSRSTSRANHDPSTPTSPASGLTGTFGGPTKKTTITIDDSREPILYRNPDLDNPVHEQQQQYKHHKQHRNQSYQAQQELEEQMQQQLIRDQHHAQLVTEGSEAWPHWPSSDSSPVPPSPPVSPTSDLRAQPTIQILSHPPYTTPTPDRLTSPISPPPAQKSFYNSDDITAAPININQLHKHNTDIHTITTTTTTTTTNPIANTSTKKNVDITTCNSAGTTIPSPIAIPSRLSSRRQVLDQYGVNPDPRQHIQGYHHHSMSNSSKAPPPSRALSPPPLRALSPPPAYPPLVPRKNERRRS